MTLLQQNKETYTAYLNREKEVLVNLKKELAKQKIKVADSIKKFDIAKVKHKETIRLAKVKKENERKRLALLEMRRITLAIEEKKHQKELKQLALKKEKEKKRLALLKKKKLEEAQKRRLANSRFMSKIEEIAELEKLDLFESDQIGDELSLFRQEKKKSSKGFKPFDKWFKFSGAYSSMLKNIETSNSGREALKGTFMLSPHSYYFLGATASLDLNNYNNIYYQPDFSYSFGYSDWHQDTFSWNYSNYANNKFNPKDDESRFNFQSGNWELSYKTKVEDVPLLDTFKLSGKIKYKPSSNSKKVYLKAKTVVLDDVMLSAQIKHNITNKQNRLTLSAKTFLYDKFFVSGTAYEYYKPDSIGSNDGEYAYSFGWSDSKPFHPSIVYSNYYTPTRWDSTEGPKFKEGTLSIKFNLDF
ncbi:MAG: Unknown protein [uncultured Sulfurovum sp.]|uniref:Uncharacterized protein n=1 Tax=uncultured Sulfurovum sp. TaxID=269237 RepID=A0A6S6TNL0_9BACT|nr:MAG: Unknown protein [uncultured Sulfurovum sp.]